jgi:outer membrane protein TolC
MALDSAAATIVRAPAAGWSLVAAALLCTMVSGQAQETSSTRIDGLVREAARRFVRVGQPQDPLPPATAVGQQTADQPMRSLTLDDAVKLALERNLDIAVQRSNPPAFDLELASLNATYLPTVSSLLGNQHQPSTPITLLTGGQHVTTTTGTFNGEVTQNVPRGGGALSVAWNNNRVFSNSSFYKVDTAKVARELAQEKLDAEEKKFEAGLSTNYFVVQAQKDLADAQNGEFQAQVNYRKSLVDFERVQQTTLQTAGVTIVSPAGLTPPAVGSGRQASPASSGVFIS